MRRIVRATNCPCDELSMRRIVHDELSATNCPCDELSGRHIHDHINLFHRARVPVGPHDAGLMNTLWSPPGTHVVEIGYTTGMTLPDMYAEISLHLEHHYWICKDKGDYSSPINVDIEAFTYIFNQIIHELETDIVSRL